MKTATYWWGVAFLAQTDSDNLVLEQLFEKTGDKQDHAYEADGKIEFINDLTKANFKELDFTEAECKGAKSLLIISR